MNETHYFTGPCAFLMDPNFGRGNRPRVEGTCPLIYAIALSCQFSRLWKGSAFLLGLGKGISFLSESLYKYGSDTR